MYDNFNEAGKNAEQIRYSDLIDVLRTSISAQRMKVIVKAWRHAAHGAESIAWD